MWGVTLQVLGGTADLGCLLEDGLAYLPRGEESLKGLQQSTNLEEPWTGASLPSAPPLSTAWAALRSLWQGWLLLVLFKLC